MQYDPIKRSLGSFFNASPSLRKLFYCLLNVLLLRTWHVKRAFKQWAKDKKSASILDAGMGFGQYAYFMAKRNASFTIKGVDVKEEQVTDCNRFFEKIKQKNASFAVADLTQLTEKESYDFILSVDVMEHIEEDVLVFKNFYASMNKGAMLLISTPSDQGALMFTITIITKALLLSTNMCAMGMVFRKLKTSLRKPDFRNQKRIILMVGRGKFRGKSR